MNIILVSHKIVANTVESIINSTENLSLLATINTVKPDFVDTIIDYEPDVVIMMRGVPFKTKSSLEDIIMSLREDAPGVRIIYVYGEVADIEDYDEVAGFLAENGVFDVVGGQTNESDFLELLAHPMTEADALQIKEHPICKSEEPPKIEVSAGKIVKGNNGSRSSRYAIKSKSIASALDLEQEKPDIPDGENLIIGITQLHRRNGCTHTALEIATMLALYENSVCALIGNEKTYVALDVKDKGCVDIFPYAELERVRGEYTYIVCDFGLFDDNCRQELEQCSVKIMLCSAADWDADSLRAFISGEDGTEEIDYCFFPISRTKFVRCNRQFAKNKYRSYRLKISNDWSLPCDENCAVYVDIIRGHVDVVNKQQERK